MAQNSEIEKLERRWADNPLGLTFAPLAEAYRRAGDPAMALEVLTAGLTTHAGYVPALIVQARCHLDAGLDAEAEASFRNVLASDAHNLIALKGLADITERTDRLQETRQYLDRLLEADPTHEEGRVQLARVTDRWMARVAIAPVEPAFAPRVLTEPTPAEPGIPEFDPAAIEIDAGWSREDPAPATEAPSAGIADPAMQELEPAPLDVSGDGQAGSAEGASMGDQGGSELLIEREVSPFEGFDPAGWDLPFADAPLPDQPFEESMPLGSISLEQGYVSNPAEATPLEGVVRHTDEGTAPDPSAQADPLPGLMQVDGDAVDQADTSGVAELSSASAAEAAEADLVPPVPGWMPAAAVREGADEAMPSLHPMDIPDFAEWDEPLPEELPAPAMPHAALVGEAPETPAPAPNPWDSEAPIEAAMAAAIDSSLPPAASEAPETPGAREHGGEGADQPGILLSTAAPEQPLWPEDPPTALVDEVAGFAPLESGELVEEAVFVVEGAAEELPAESSAPEAEVEPELVITETMAEVFLRQGHKPLALAVYAQLLERDPANARLGAAVARLRADLLPPAAANAAGGAATDEPVGALLARVLDPESARPSLPDAVAPEAPPGGHPTQAAGEPALSLSAIFGEEASRPRNPAPAAPTSEPSFDEFFGASSGPHGVAAGAGGEEADLEQFNAWLRGLQR